MLRICTIILIAAATVFAQAPGGMLNPPANAVNKLDKPGAAGVVVFNGTTSAVVSGADDDCVKKNGTAAPCGGNVGVQANGSSVSPSVSTLDIQGDYGVLVTGDTPTGKARIKVAQNTATAASRDMVASGIDTYATCTGTAGAEVCTMAGNALAAYTTGMVIRTKFSQTNTTTKTVQYGGLATKSVLRFDGTALTAGDIQADVVYPLIDYGTEFRLPPSGGAPAFVPYAVQVRRTTAFSAFTGGVYTAVPWSSTVFDTSGSSMWNGSNPERLVAPVSGYYGATCGTQTNSSGVGIFIAAFKNGTGGTQLPGVATAIGTPYATAMSTHMVNLTAGDYVVCAYNPVSTLTPNASSSDYAAFGSLVKLW